MKKLFKLAFVAAIAAVAGNNIYQSQSVMNGMSEMALANVEALASGENSKGAQSIIIQDKGSGWDCINGYHYNIIYYRVECVGEGNLPCESGDYERYESTNQKCYEA